MEADQPIIIVSGLPRSGTSLMMQILSAGGIPVLTDSLRSPDDSNPRGYFEYEKVKWLANDNSWLGEVRGRALKVIAQLVPFLPRGFRYQAIFMRRDLREVLQSQSTMIRALGMTPGGDATTLAPAFERQLVVAMEFVRQCPTATMEELDYHELVTQPVATVERIIQFLQRFDLDRQTMIDAVDARLYRSKFDVPSQQ